MNNSITLKEALNRQFVALTTHLPFESGSFEYKRSEAIGSNKPSISFKSFERAYPVFQDSSSSTLEAR
jgi:hypothetical protein